MDLAHPLMVVTPTVDGDVLRVLTQADVEFTPARVHAVLGERSLDGVRRSLERLTAQGIVIRREAGPAYLYQLNRDHLAAPHVVALANLRDTLLNRLGEFTSGWSEPPVYGALFGSGARRDHTATSDIDLLLVSSDDADPEAWAAHTLDLTDAATRWTGNDTRVLTWSEGRVRTLAGREHVLDEIARDGITFCGEPNWLRYIVNKQPLHDGSTSKRRSQK